MNTCVEPVSQATSTHDAPPLHVLEEAPSHSDVLTNDEPDSLPPNEDSNPQIETSIVPQKSSHRWTKQVQQTLKDLRPDEIELLNIGTVLVIDDLLTEEPDHSSTVVGRAKGIYEFSDVKGNAIHMVFSVVFENKKYNGSTLEIHGTDIFTRSSGSEVSVVGGTGKLRYARGYSNVTLHSAVGFDGILKFNIFFRLD
ncbi:hypothetical protein SUGI_0647380 [Cryptomeria japonica]|nr:hypothetical protein SUGI_0647380 [Cryptomeria japonica]